MATGKRKAPQKHWPGPTDPANPTKAEYRRENEERAGRVKDILLQQYDETGGDETNLTDLLADIRHFCDIYAVEFAEADRVAHNHYTAEVVEAGHPKSGMSFVGQLADADERFHRVAQAARQHIEAIDGDHRNLAVDNLRIVDDKVTSE